MLRIYQVLTSVLRMIVVPMSNTCLMLHVFGREHAERRELGKSSNI